MKINMAIMMFSFSESSILAVKWSHDVDVTCFIAKHRSHKMKQFYV